MPRSASRGAAAAGQLEGERDRLRAELAGGARRRRGSRGLAGRGASAELKRAPRRERELRGRRRRAAGSASPGSRASWPGASCHGQPAAGRRAPRRCRRPRPLADPAAPPATAPRGRRRRVSPRPRASPTTCKLISGIGPGIERTLHELGIFHFRQIAAFTPENVAWVNRRLRFKGRIEREDWIGQARSWLPEEID